MLRLPGVHEVAVIGVPPDERAGEVGRAFVATLPGAELTEDTVIAFCKERLAGFKVPPRSVRFVDHLPPRNPSGKVLKNVLREEKS